MKKEILGFSLATLLILGVGVLMGRNVFPKVKVQTVFPPHYYTEDTPSAVCSSKYIQLVAVDTVDGRPTFTVMFPDSTVLDSMYPEEIANGLNTGKWDYNEMLKITGRE
jgi:hypothetical protein